MHEIKENRENVYRSLTEAMKSPDFNDYYFLARYYIAVENYDKAREALNNSENVSEKLVFLNMYKDNPWWNLSWKSLVYWILKLIQGETQEE